MPEDQELPAAMIEPIARHCRDSGHMRPGLGKAKFSAFMPAPNNQVSVFYAVGQSPGQLKAIGRMFVHPTVKGHALVPTAAVQGRGLQVVADPAPHPLHANIVGWSAEDGANRLHARALAEASNLVPYTD